MRTLDKRVRLADIINTAAIVWGTPLSDILGPIRARRLVHIRTGIIVAARAMIAPPSAVAIGKALGGRDHSSVLNLAKKADREERHYPDLTRRIDELFARLNGMEPEPPVVIPIRPIIIRPTKKPRNRFANDDVVDFNMMMRAGSAALLAAMNDARQAA